MKTADARRRLVEVLRSGDLLPIASEFVRAMGVLHNRDETVIRLSTKIVSRHRFRPGRRRNPKRDQNMRQALAWIHFNRKALGKDAAIQRAADEFGLTANSLKHALEGRVQKFRKRMPNPNLNYLGDPNPKA